jgi:hypothetical protein
MVNDRGGKRGPGKRSPRGPAANVSFMGYALYDVYMVMVEIDVFLVVVLFLFLPSRLASPYSSLAGVVTFMKDTSLKSVFTKPATRTVTVQHNAR